MKKNTVFITILGAFFLFSLLVTYARGVQSDIARQVLRLHIVANSNSDSDQELKYAIRDRIVAETQELFATTQSPTETREIAEANLQIFREIAESEIVERGYDYNVTVELRTHAFPSTVYGEILLPAGRYDALKITIGAGAGENWWCVLFPTLCFIDGVNMEMSPQARETLRENLSDRDYALITGSTDGNIPVQVRFRVVDLFAGLF